MKHLEKCFLPPDNIFKIHWDTIKIAAAAAFYSFEPFLTHIAAISIIKFKKSKAELLSQSQALSQISRLI